MHSKWIFMNILLCHHHQPTIYSHFANWMIPLLLIQFYAMRDGFWKWQHKWATRCFHQLFTPMFCSTELINSSRWKMISKLLFEIRFWGHQPVVHLVCQAANHKVSGCQCVLFIHLWPAWKVTTGLGDTLNPAPFGRCNSCRTNRKLAPELSIAARIPLCLAGISPNITSPNHSFGDGDMMWYWLSHSHSLRCVHSQSLRHPIGVDQFEPQGWYIHVMVIGCWYIRSFFSSLAFL